MLEVGSPAGLGCLARVEAKQGWGAWLGWGASVVLPLPPRTCAPIRRACPWWLRPATASMGPSGGPPACCPQRSRSGMSVSRAGSGLGVQGTGCSRACWAVPGWHCPGPPGLEHTPSLGGLLCVAVSAGGGGTAPLAPDRRALCLEPLQAGEACFRALLSPPTCSTTRGHGRPCTQTTPGSAATRERVRVGVGRAPPAARQQAPGVLLPAAPPAAP